MHCQTEQPYLFGIYLCNLVGLVKSHRKLNLLKANIGLVLRTFRLISCIAPWQDRVAFQFA